jgi:hypothetical protein
MMTRAVRDCQLVNWTRAKRKGDATNVETFSVQQYVIVWFHRLEQFHAKSQPSLSLPTAHITLLQYMGDMRVNSPYGAHLSKRRILKPRVKSRHARNQDHDTIDEAFVHGIAGDFIRAVFRGERSHLFRKRGGGYNVVNLSTTVKSKIVVVSCRHKKTPHHFTLAISTGPLCQWRIHPIIFSN